MSTKARWRGGVLEFYDSVTHETVQRMAPMILNEDFQGADTAYPAGGAEESGCHWSKMIVGVAPPTVAGVADAAGGVVQCALTADNQKQDAGLYMGDQRNYDLTKGLVMEFRAKLSVTPTDVAEAVLGLVDDWSDGLIDSAAYQVSFNMDGATAIHCQSDDTATDLDVDTGLTALTTAWNIYKIDATVVSDIKFYVNGASVCGSTTFAFAGTGANAILQPYFGLYKATGTGVGTLQVDYVKIWQNR